MKDSLSCHRGEAKLVRDWPLTITAYVVLSGIITYNAMGSGDWRRLLAIPLAMLVDTLFGRFRVWRARRREEGL